jgi:hypothetical protein
MYGEAKYSELSTSADSGAWFGLCFLQLDAVTSGLVDMLCLLVNCPEHEVPKKNAIFLCKMH